MQKNVGDLDALIRIWGGLFMLGLGITRESTALMAIGSGKAAEGITRFCPLLYMLGISTTEEKISPEPLVREEKRMNTPQAQYQPQSE